MTSNKQIVLKALQTELEKVKKAAINHEKKEYEVNMAGATEVIKDYFNGIVEGIKDISCTASDITIYPGVGNDYDNRIELSVRNYWSSKPEWYVELKSYRPDISSNADNTESVFYYTVVAEVAKCFTLISEEYLNVWRPKMLQFEKAKEDFYTKMHEIEREIRNVENQIAEEEKLTYHKTGFAVTLKDYYDWDYNDGDYTVESKPYDLRQQIGRSRWDYIYFNSFKVVSYPKTKHGKVVIEYQRSGEGNVAQKTELNKQRFSDLVDAVHNWQTKGAEERQKSCEARVNRRNTANA
jgi:hypothetical protein